MHSMREDYTEVAGGNLIGEWTHLLLRGTVNYDLSILTLNRESGVLRWGVLNLLAAHHDHWFSPSRSAMMIVRRYPFSARCQDGTTRTYIIRYNNLITVCTYISAFTLYLSRLSFLFVIRQRTLYDYNTWSLLVKIKCVYWSSAEVRLT
jgi:hypothetical protein